MEAHLRSPPALLFPGPPRCVFGRSPGRAAAAGQRRLQHRRRPYRGARVVSRACPPKPVPVPRAGQVARPGDSAGATYEFVAACRQRGVGLSFGFPVTEEVRLAISLVPEDVWEPAIEADGEERDGAYLAEVTRMLDPSPWPEGSRVVVRRERPHPGAALTLFEVGDGWRYTAFITDTGRGKVPGGIAGLELRHRRHARRKTAYASQKPPAWPTSPAGAQPSAHSGDSGQPFRLKADSVPVENGQPEARQRPWSLFSCQPAQADDLGQLIG